MVAKFPVDGETTTASAMAWGFNPYLMEADQFAGAYLSVVESIAKLVAAGFEHKRAYLSFQEYFERLRTEAERWGKPMAAVLGALMAQVDLRGQGRPRRLARVQGPHAPSRPHRPRHLWRGLPSRRPAAARRV